MIVESRFTKPTDLCPRPEWWHALDDESAEHEVTELLYGLTRALQPRNVLETGTAFGVTARSIGNALRRNGHGHLWTVESNEHRHFQAARASDPELSISYIHGSSTHWTPPGDVVFDFCFFDAYFKLRVTEFQHYRPWMRVGTIVAFHDTSPGNGLTSRYPDSDVRSVISRELRQGVRLIHLPTPRGLTLGEVFR